MLDFQSVRLLHRHATDWAEMKPRTHHEPAEHDRERGWAKGAVYECDCGDAFTVAPEDVSEREAANPR